jgi:hypothetical protein
MPALAAELETLLQLEAPPAGDPRAFLASGKRLPFDGPLTLLRADATNLRDDRHANSSATRGPVSVDAAQADVSSKLEALRNSKTLSPANR